jgi:hypothetical protein
MSEFTYSKCEPNLRRTRDLPLPLQLSGADRREGRLTHELRCPPQ